MAGYWRWVHVGVAALAMVLTLPGRTQGLGLFTEPLLKDLGLDQESYAFMNVWATLLGALFCLPCGWLLDNLGTRAVLVGVTTALGATVLAMSVCVTGDWTVPLHLSVPDWLGGPVHLVVAVDLFVFLVLTRGLGQSALSVVSLALIGRSAGQRSGIAMGVFAVATSLGFITAFGILGRPEHWRPSWAGIGVTVLVLGLVGGFLVRNGALDADPARHNPFALGEGSRTLSQALGSPTFWTFSVAISFLGMVLAGTSLFGESIFKERGLERSALADYGLQKMVFVNAILVGIPFGLAANLLVGWLAIRWSLSRLMALATGLFALALLAFPLVATEAEAYTYAAVLAVAGGGMTVCFYSVYRQAFGPAHLGSIQGLAQMMTVLFSAVGPQIFATTKIRLGAYESLFPIFAGVAVALALLTWAVGMPRRRVVAPVAEEAAV